MSLTWCSWSQNLRFFRPKILFWKVEDENLFFSDLLALKVSTCLWGILPDTSKFEVQTKQRLNQRANMIFRLIIPKGTHTYFYGKRGWAPRLHHSSELLNFASPIFLFLIWRVFDFRTSWSQRSIHVRFPSYSKEPLRLHWGFLVQPYTSWGVTLTRGVGKFNLFTSKAPG